MYSDFRKWLWLTAVAAFVGGIAVWLTMQERPSAPASQGLQGAQGQMQAARLYPAARPLSEFSLSQGPDAPLNREALKGHWHWVFFGFTNCPDICPMTLHELGLVERDIGDSLPERLLPKTVFVSVDPERDDDELMASYAGHFGDRVIAATGSDEELMRLGRQLGAIYMTIEGEEHPDGYTVDHTASVFLINPKAELVANFPYPHRAETLRADYLKILQLLGEDVSR